MRTPIRSRSVLVLAALAVIAAGWIYCHAHARHPLHDAPTTGHSPGPWNDMETPPLDAPMASTTVDSLDRATETRARSPAAHLVSATSQTGSHHRSTQHDPMRHTGLSPASGVAETDERTSTSTDSPSQTSEQPTSPWINGRPPPTATVSQLRGSFFTPRPMPTKPHPPWKDPGTSVAPPPSVWN